MKSIQSWVSCSKYITIHSYPDFLPSLFPPGPNSHMPLLSLFHIARADLKADSKTDRSWTDCKGPNSVFRAKEKSPPRHQRYPFERKGAILQKPVFLFFSLLEVSSDQCSYWVLEMEAVGTTVFLQKDLRCYLGHSLSRFIFWAVPWFWKRDEDAWMEARI